MPEARIHAAIEAADEAFWTVIVNHFPEVATGDMPPPELFFWGNAMKRATNAWLESNLPEESA